MDAGTKTEGHHSTEEQSDVQQDHSIAVSLNASKEANVGSKPQGEVPATTGPPKRKALKEITKKHPEFELSYDMMVGIRYAVSLSEPSVSLTSSKTHTNTASESLQHPDAPSDDDDEELESDFQKALKFTFPHRGTEHTPAHAMRDFRFKDYCPEIFRQLREWFGISAAEYLVTITGDFNFLEFLSNSKSGQFFFFSHNKQFLIKTMTHSESLFLRKILPHYFKYVSRQPHTFVTKFFGMHRITVHGRSPIYILIMGSVFYTNLPIHVQYDLKGSTKGRKATVKDKEVGAILKDLDFLENKQLIQVGSIKAKLFKEQLRRDTEFLRQMKIMDYSLLVGICRRDLLENEEEKEKEKNNDKEKDNENEKENEKENEVPADNSTKPSPKEDGTLEVEAKKEVADEDNENSQHPQDEPNEYFHPSDIRTIPENEEVVDSGGGNGSGLTADKDGANSATNGAASFVKVKRPKLYKKTTPSEFGLQLLSGIGSNKTANAPTNASGDTNASAASDNRGNADNGARTMIDSSVSTTNAKTESRFESHSRNSTETNGDNMEKSIVQSLSQELGEEEMEEKELQSQNPFTSEYGGMCWEDEHGNKGNEIYFCGLIDILQKYNRRKKLEHFTVSLKHDPKTISAVPPDFYAKRMREFLEDKIV